MGRSIDALILELRHKYLLKNGGVKKTFEEILNGRIQKEDSDLVEYCKKKKIPIFVTEPETTRRLYNRSFLNALGESIIFSPVFLTLMGYYSTSGKKRKINKFSKNILSKLFGANQNLLMEAMNALTAHHVENKIAPSLTEILGRKPLIDLNYGAAHMGMFDHFQNPKRRKRSLNIWKEVIKNSFYQAKFDKGWNISKNTVEKD